MRTGVHRSVLVLTAAVAFAAPASAAEVARTEGARLDARDSAPAAFCLDLREGDKRSARRSATCGRAPWRPRRSILITWSHDDRLLLGGAVPASVARAEAELSDGRRLAF